MKDTHTGPHTNTPDSADPQTQQIPIPRALQLAADHHNAGRLQQAEQILQKILHAVPQQPDALNLMGALAHRVGKMDIAASYFEKACNAAPDNAQFHANLCEALRSTGKPDDAAAAGRKAISLDPDHVGAYSNLGIALFDLGDHEAAKQMHEKALQKNPQYAPSLNNLGSIYHDANDHDKAEQYYRQAIAANPDYLEPQNNLGETLLRTYRYDDAAAILETVVRKNPHYVEALCNLGYTYLNNDRPDDARAQFRNALHIKPDHAKALVGLARIAREKQQNTEAQTLLDTALSHEPELTEARTLQGTIYLEDGFPDQARACFNDILAIDPDHESARLGLGHIYLEEGDFAAAKDLFSGVLDHKEGSIPALFCLAQAQKVKKDSRLVPLLQQKEKDDSPLPRKQTLYLHFALGKMYDDLGDHHTAFTHYIKGCRLQRETIDYDADVKDRQFADVRSIFTPAFIAANRTDPSAATARADNLPVFIVGMPRSGTTLTEQIIASHPDAYGAGELFDLLDVAGWRSHDNTSQPPRFPHHIADCDPADFDTMAHDYLDRLRGHLPSQHTDTPKRITDKMPINFMNIGLIHMLFPRATIIHVNRHPLDTCISCFTRLFAHNQNNTYDLYELGRFWRAYKHMMDYWRDSLPDGRIYDLQYEDLVTDTETEARKLIDHCGLTWDDACLDFHKTQRNIRTASVTQVRQPIYKSSMARWKRYDDFLGPLIDGLGDAYDHRG